MTGNTNHKFRNQLKIFSGRHCETEIQGSSLCGKNHLPSHTLENSIPFWQRTKAGDFFEERTAA
jgi:hypothetical protein